MVKIKPMTQISANYRGSIPEASRRYKAGTSVSVGWKEAAIAGQSTYVAKMSDPTILERRRRALELTSEGEWVSGCQDKGAARISSGMTAGVDKQSRGFAPYHSVIAAITLPPRGLTASENVMNRCLPIAEALEAKKKELLG